MCYGLLNLSVDRQWIPAKLAKSVRIGFLHPHIIDSITITAIKDDPIAVNWGVKEPFKLIRSCKIIFTYHNLKRVGHCTSWQVSSLYYIISHYIPSFLTIIPHHKYLFRKYSFLLWIPAQPSWHLYFIYMRHYHWMPSYVDEFLTLRTNCSESM